MTGRANAAEPDWIASRKRWRAVHLAGDRNPPLSLPEPRRPFWKSDIDLKAARRG